MKGMLNNNLNDIDSKLKELLQNYKSNHIN